MSRPIVLIGFMGAGKSSAARVLDPDFLDSDLEIQRRTGRSVGEIIETDGEPAFRNLEAEVVSELLSAAPPVISLGGGAPITPRVAHDLKLSGSLVVWLDVELATAWARVSRSGSARRPFAANKAAFSELFTERRPAYRRLAHVVIPNDRDGTVARAAKAIRDCSRLRPGARMHWAVSASSEYPVYVANDLIPIGSKAGFQAPGSSVAPTWPGPGRSFVVTDSNVARHVLDPLGWPQDRSAVFELEPGEESKRLDVAGRICESMAASGWTRADHIVALGGGVVGDLAGFCAHTYQRGIAVVHVPTTVVAQVDSAYGGKTGVDLPAAKNYVGAYHMPAAVLADPSLTRTLPMAEYAAGFVEVVKTALLAGGDLWERVRGLPASTEALFESPDLVFGCASYKCGVVARDERDSGLRQVLNLGHTVGHAIESASGFGTFRHGEAVGIGLLAALRLSGADTLREEVSAILDRWNLPQTTSGLSPVSVQSILDAMKLDKKRVGASVPFVLIESPGEPQHGCTVPEHDVRTAVAEVVS